MIMLEKASVDVRWVPELCCRQIFWEIEKWRNHVIKAVDHFHVRSRGISLREKKREKNKVKMKNHWFVYLC